MQRYYILCVSAFYETLILDSSEYWSSFVLTKNSIWVLEMNYMGFQTLISVRLIQQDTPVDVLWRCRSLCTLNLGFLQLMTLWNMLQLPTHVLVSFQSQTPARYVPTEEYCRTSYKTCIPCMTDSILWSGNNAANIQHYHQGFPRFRNQMGCSFAWEASPQDVNLLGQSMLRNIHNR